MPDAKPMSPERLAEIEKLSAPPFKGTSVLARLAMAIPDLLAEVRRLQAGPDWAELRAARRLNEAGAKAIEALELIQESARERIAALETGLREAATTIEGWVQSETQCDNYEDDIDWKTAQRLRALADGVHYDKEPT